MFNKSIQSRPIAPRTSSGSKVDAYKASKELATRVGVERAGNGFVTDTHYPSKGVVTSVHSNIHSVNTHLRSALGSPKGNLRNE
jgi:hypothetical protein